MKKLLLTLLLLLPIYISAQSNRGKIEISKDEFPLYQGVINIENKSADNLYSTIKAWIATNYNSANNVIQLDDKENHKLILKGENPFVYKSLMGGLEGKGFYTLTIDAKDNRFRYTLNFTEVEVGTAHQSAYKELIEKPNKKHSKSVQEQITRFKDNLTTALSYIYIQNTSADEW